MRRYATFVLLGLGVFAVAAGLLLRLYAYPRLAKVPHDIDTLSVARGTGITALVYVPEGDRARPEIREGLTLTSSTKVTGNLRAEEVTKDGDVTVWVEASKVTSDDDGLVVTAGLRSLCLDRHSGEGVTPCENQYYEDVSGQRVVADRGERQQPGLSFKFPFDTQRRDYLWYDGNVKQALDIRYLGEEDVRGLTTYRFVQQIPPTRIDERDVPGALVGEPGVPTVRAELYYEVTRTLFVEPVTGKVIAGGEDVRQELRTEGQGVGQGTVVFDGELTLDDKTVAANVAESEKNVSRLSLITGLPPILWAAGGVLLAVSLLMFFAAGRGRHSRPGPPTKVAAPV
ncbi:hypothetical protein F4560_002517 [Saccharothrix ecbatanensis]|uniref:DUF3068 family protein n=1 Tax=Saccharothrix ecbatanensis TaxID=1105145 RepID=A0A7W9HJ25_9PSEU|nr:DUF3068 domain-containing protein [Saccharothrix ecbatanensis]MBB5802749.1 hypothetical protein [Saccharothrix ecbatanensis]